MALRRDNPVTGGDDNAPGVGMAENRKTAQPLRTALLTLVLAAGGLYHVLVHDHWLATARSWLPSMGDLAGATPILVALVWLVVFFGGMAGIVFFVCTYTRNLPVWLERTRLVMALLLSLWLWTGPNAQNMFDLWVGTGHDRDTGGMFGNWLGGAVFLGDWFLFCLAIMGFLTYIRQAVERICEPEDWNGLTFLILIFTAVCLLILPVVYRVELPEAREKRAVQELRQQLPQGWQTEELRNGTFVWISPSRQLGRVVQSEKQALQDALLVSKVRPELNAANNQLPAGWKIKVVLDGGGRKYYRPINPATGDQSRWPYDERQGAVEQAWEEYHDGVLRKMLADGKPPGG